MIRGPLERLLSVGPQDALSVEDFLRRVNGLAALLQQQAPTANQVLNLCENRQRFLLVLGAALSRGLPCLLPPSRAPDVIGEMLARYPNAIAMGDDRHDDGVRLDALPERYVSLPIELPSAAAERPIIAAEQLAVIGFTSGSSGPPKPQPKRWGSFCLSTGRNLDLLRRYVDRPLHAVVTVPPQHMYGMETSVLMPLLGEISVDQGRPFFPADIAAALSAASSPRALITTPVHLKSLLESELLLPQIDLILSATAPLSQSLAVKAEQRTGAVVLELFGSTETCVIAYRETAREQGWQPHPGVHFKAEPNGTWVKAPWIDEPVLLHDRMQIDADGRFYLTGRCSDHLEIGGKRASLQEINQRLLALPGVQDAVVFIPEGRAGVTRLAALVVAPGCNARDLLKALRASVDPLFLPRPLRLVERLPRNDTGKLPREALLAALRATED
ncbi:AMP-binding protein [Pseudomarimonas arenosa]|uniref:AMP-binding protein n=1 Tax=Pseudomarimonas arenosa TaxID=2774145 RepID=UPI003CCD19CF